MWPRLGKITALVSVLASCFALLWQIQQFRKECADNVPLLKCVIQVLLPDPAKVPLPDTAKKLDDDDAWKAATREDTPEAYRQYLNHSWTRHAGQAQRRLDELAAAEWEREVKSTDSEKVLESFINRYKEGSYVRLAQERLQIAIAWTSIKNTTDPHTLSAFLANYHDSIFEKLAKDALRELDNHAWQLAANASTRETISRYITIWSAFSGRHLQDAQIKLNELDDDDAWNMASLENTPEAYRQYLNHPWTRHVAQAHKRLDELSEAASIADRRTYWDLYENDPEIKCAAISTMYSITEGAVVKFYYENPSECMRALFVSKDTLKFEGKKNGQWYRGKAYVFTRQCPGKSIGYDVGGSENYDHTLVTLRGPAPVIEKKTCRIRDLKEDSENSTLEFKARISVERSAKIKPGDKNNHIH